jgi:TolB-like protein
MARTYGMHFIDYFPHRELGIVFFEVDNLEQALKELELSLDQYPTSKTRFYLDRVRKGIIQREGKEVVPPSIRLDIETNEIWTRDDPVFLSGTVEDENYVSTVSVHGLPIFMEGSEKLIEFREKLRLSQGQHLIIVLAENLGGKTTRRSVLIHVDRQGPLITLEEIGQEKTHQGKAIKVKGSLYDEAGVVHFAINGIAIPIKKDTEIFFEETVIADNNLIEVLARDSLGNETVASIPIDRKILSSSESVLLACSDCGLSSHLMAAIFGSKDTRPPEIKLKGWTNDQTVYLEKIYIEGQVTDENKIVELTVNNAPVLKREGRLIVFGYFVELQEGENVISIKATDEGGNTTVKEIIIRRKIPVALKLDQRMSVSIMPFELRGIISDAGLSFQDSLINSLIHRNRFRVLERNLLETILQEQKLSRTKLVDQSTALKLGKLMAAQSIITGSIVETRNGIEIIARFIETETSEILDTEDVYGEGKDLVAFKALAEGMALKFHRKFPLVGGIIIDKKGNYIFTDMGEEKIGIQKRLIVYREAPVVHPISGKVLGADSEILGRARVKQVSPEMSKAELVDQKGPQVDRLDKVITE